MACLIGAVASPSTPCLAQDAMKAATAAEPGEEAPPRFEQAKLGPAGSAFVGAMNSFAIDLYKSDITPGRNLFLSPASVSTAVAMAYRGAKGVTADEIAKVMRYPVAPGGISQGVEEVMPTLSLHAPERELSVANSIWVQSGLPVERSVVAELGDRFAATFDELDFRRDSEAARLRINAWVAAKTHDRIRELLDPLNVTQDTKSVLVNAVYFKAGWSTPFSPGETKTEPFRRADGSQAQTPLMHQRANFQVVRRGSTQALAMYYVPGELQMIVLLPDSPKGLPKLEGALTAASLAEWTQALDRSELRDTILTFPRFRLDWKRDLKEVLQGLGMRTPFSAQADFSGFKRINLESSDDNDWAIEFAAIVHQAFIESDEKGSEAAATTAVTSIVVSGMRMGPPPPPPVVFRADHPFLFLIRDRRTGAILFMGRFVDPGTAGS